MVEGDTIGSPAGVARVRDVARAFVDGQGPPPASETAQTLALVVSELATNALRHGGGRYTLQLGATADAVHVAATDLSPSPRGNAPPTSTVAPGVRGAHGPPPYERGDHGSWPRAGQNRPCPPAA
ncbi:ATP-binding protein [Streptomyces sp. NBC_00631]|uniref:ATP-binding protein n=1 Tax=Streptomyces sp. NBC_00631 TaxID=2975793 RepID=UPI0030DFECB2